MDDDDDCRESPALAMAAVEGCNVGALSVEDTNEHPLSLLFSLQFYVDRVTLRSLAPSEANVSLMIGFQLLQYEIVVFDTALQAPSVSIVRGEDLNADAAGDSVVTSLRHGKSCLFEAEPDGLARDLQRDREAPLTLLLLAQERGKARLQSYASVPLSLHVGLRLESDDDALSSSMLHRICEWASQSGMWELRDHRNRTVGSVIGAVTLSCLGKTLAPHLANALGIQVGKSQPSSPRTQSPAESTKKQQSRRPVEAAVSGQGGKEEGGAAVDKLLAPEPALASAVEEKQVTKSDSGVQCDEEQLNAPEAAFASLSLLNGDTGIRLDMKRKVLRTGSSNAVEKVHHKSSKRNSSTKDRDRRHQSRDSSRGSSEGQTLQAASRESLFSRELPPPLFFQKGSRMKKA
ncbi:hypothetical protein BBJ28_00005344 [Nothophytophthora sp. Chile5]|nr:hypothetical protein BBJ28_00005344 [Nothophytophthora sp. Chile5]